MIARLICKLNGTWAYWGAPCGRATDMSKFSSYSGAPAGVAAAAVVAIAAGLGWYFLKPASMDAPIAVMQAPEGTTGSEPTNAQTSEVAAASKDASTPQPTETPTPPTIDEVRLEADGVFVVAGRAAPDSTVSVLLDGVENTTTQASGQGAFATVTLIEPSTQPQILSVIQRGPDGDVIGAEEIVLAPMTPQSDATQVAEAGQAADAVGEAVTPAQGAADPKPEEVAVATAETTPAPAADAPAQVAAAGDAMAGEAATDTAETPAVTAQTELAQTEAPTQTADTVTTAAQEDTAQTADATEPSQQAQPTATQDTKLTAENAAPAQTDTGTPTPADTTVAILKSDAGGVELVNSPVAMAELNVSIDTIGYSDDGSVQLSGRAIGRDGSVRIYLDNAAIIDLPVDARGRWRGDLPHVDGGVYTLRVDEMNPQGEVVSRAETPFKREDPAALAAQSGPQDTPVKAVTVQTGNTLWAIARDRYGEGVMYVRVFEANRDSIRNPDLIYPGQVFNLPD